MAFEQRSSNKKSSQGGSSVSASQLEEARSASVEESQSIIDISQPQYEPQSLQENTIELNRLKKP